MGTAPHVGYLVGYARVDTGQQTLDGQCDALNAVGVDRIFDDVMSGTCSDRPSLAAALDYVREGDTLVVPAFNRLGRSLVVRSTPSTHCTSAGSTFERFGKASTRPQVAWSPVCSHRWLNLSEADP